MKVLIDSQEFIAEDVRIEKKLMKRESVDEYTSLLKWKLQMLYFDGTSWVQICRIDNYPHEGVAGTHMHTDRVQQVDVSFQEAYDILMETGSRILKDRYRRILG